jgi:hypothetical protein
MATKLQQLRSQYPQYKDLSDEDLAKGFHKKFYPDMDFDTFAERIGLTQKAAPAGTETVQTFADGGRILRDTKTGQEVYASEGYSTSDAETIARIREEQGQAGEVSRQRYAEDILGQLGPVPSRAASMIKGVPFVGSYIDEAIGMVSPKAGQATRAAQEAREIVAPTQTAIERAGVGLATALPSAAYVAPSIAMAPIGTSLGSRILAGGALGVGGGAVEGGIYGLGEGRTREERKAAGISGAKIGAAFGGPLGAAGPAIGGLIGGVAGNRVAAPAKQISRQIGAKGQALDLLSAAAQMDEPVAAEAMQRAGRYASLGQMGPSTQGLLDLAASSTSEGAAIARKNIDEVAGQAGAQFNKLLDDALGGPQAAAQLQDLLMETSAPARKAAYDAAYGTAENPVIINYASDVGQQLQDLVKRVDADVIRKAERLMRMEGQPSKQIGVVLGDAGNIVEFETLPDVRQIDYITRALRDVSPTAAPEEKGVSRALASQIRSTLDELVPEYKTARDLAGDVISLRDAIDFGKDMLNPKVTRYDVAKTVKGMGDAELTALRQGIRGQLDEIMANTKGALSDPNQDAREMVKPLKDMMSRAAQEKLRTILGDQADDFFRQLDEVYSAISMRAGIAQQSKTAPRLMAQEAAKDAIAPTLGQLVQDRGPLGGAFEALRRSATSTPSQQEAFQALMGEIALPLTRQKDLTTLMQEMQALRTAAPQIQRGRGIYEAGKAAGTYGATGLTPAMQSLLGYR